MTRPASFATCVIQVFVFALLVSGTSKASAQAFSIRPMTQSGRFIEAPRSVQQQLREAQRSLEKGEESDAVVRLGDLLQRDAQTFGDADLAGQDFFIGIESVGRSGRVAGSLLRRARQMIGELSPAALETYQLRYGPLAARMLDEAAATRDWEAVRTVRRQYFHTVAGYRASFLLAQRELFAGRPLAASLLLDDVVTMPRAVAQLGSAVVDMHAAASKLAGRTLAPPTDPTDQSNETTATENARIDKYAVTLSDAGGETRDYAMFGGTPNRNGLSVGQMPLTNVRWDLPTTASPRQRRALENVASDLAATGKLPPPSWLPLRVGDQLLMRTTERLVGVDYRTGKRVWTWPWFSPAFNEEQVPFDSLPGGEGPGDLLSQRVWNDLPYGQLTSDGQRVFMIDDLGEVEVTSIGPLGFGGVRPSDTKTNTLVALDLPTEGKLLWRLGAGADDTSELSGAFFLGPPLPLDGRLYVMMELAGDINLSCLDPATGRELWRQQLVAVESGSVNSDPIRRVAGATPTYHEGLLICPTGAGVIVAIDLCDRMLRWGIRFDRNSEMNRSITNRGSLEVTQLMQRWYSGTAIAVDDTLLVTPVESDRLFALNVLTGEPRFQEKNRVRQRYLAGARDGRFLVVSADQVRAFDLHTGNQLWTSEADMLTAGQQIIGRGVFGDGDYLIPTTSNQLIRISLEDGKVLQRRNTRYPLGNLVAVGGEIIVQGSSTISVAYGEKSLEPLITEMLKKDPNDFEALVRKSELLIQRGQRREALELLARARAIDPLNDEVHMLSVSAMLGAFRENLDVDAELIETLDQLIERENERADFLSYRVRAALQKKQFQEATVQLLDLSKLLANVPALDSETDQVVGDAVRYCSLGSWLAARAADVAKLADDSQRAAINQAVSESVAPLMQGSNTLMSRMVRHFAALEGIEPMRSELADRYANAGAALELERLALGTEIPTPDGLRSLSTERLLVLARSYAERRFGEDAIAAVEVLRTREAAEEISKEIDEIADLARRTPAAPRWGESVELDWESQQVLSRGFSVPTQRVAVTKVTAGKRFENWYLVSEGLSPLALRDPSSGQLRQIVVEGFDGRLDVDKEAQICGSFMVIVLPTELIGVNLYSALAGDGEPVVWRRALSGDGGPIAKRRSDTMPFEDQVIKYPLVSGAFTNDEPEFRLGPVLGDRLLMAQGGDLIALDLQTKEPLWRNSSAPRSGAVLQHEGRVAVVSPANREVVFFDLLDGRRLDSVDWQYGPVWATAGNHVLCYQQEGTTRLHHVKLVDPFAGDVLLQTSALESNRSNADIPCSYGRVVAGRYLAMLDSEGQALVWDLVEAKEISRPKLPAYPDLQGLQAVLLDGQLILLPRRRVPRPRLSEPAPPQTGDSKHHVTVHAVHSVSLADGEVVWSKEFETPWGCTVHQPASTPILVLTRSRSTYTSPTSSRSQKLDALAIDVRDGRELDKTLGKSVISRNNSLQTRLTIQPGLSRVLVQIGGELLTYKFETPPSEPAE